MGRDAPVSGRPAQRALALLVLPVLALGVFALRSATMAQPDRLVPGTRTTLSFEVDRRDRPGSADDVRALWAVCGRMLTTAQRSGELRVEPAGRGRVTVSPAVGELQRKRLTGCIEDTILDRALGRVLELREGPAPA